MSRARSSASVGGSGNVEARSGLSSPACEGGGGLDGVSSSSEGVPLAGAESAMTVSPSFAIAALFAFGLLAFAAAIAAAAAAASICCRARKSSRWLPKVF